MQQLSTSVAAVCGTMGKIAECTSDLFSTHKKFNSTVQSHKWERMQDAYGAINQTVIVWGSAGLTPENNLRKQNESFQSNLLKVFQYSVRESESFVPLLTLRRAIGAEYFNAWYTVDSQKEKLFAGGDVTKWEVDFSKINLVAEDIAKNKKIAKLLMLPQQTQTLKAMQKVFGYMNLQLAEQSEFIGLKRARRYLRAVTSFCNELIENYSEVASIEP